MFLKVSNKLLAYPDPEPPIIKILYGWSGIKCQFGLWFISNYWSWF